VYFNVNFNVFFKIKECFFVSELYIHQNAWCNNKNSVLFISLFIMVATFFGHSLPSLGQLIET